MRLMDAICNRCGFAKVNEGNIVVGYINSWRIVRCPDCDLVYVDPQPNEETLLRIYANYHEETGQEVLCKTGERALFEQVLDKVQKIRPTGKLLDVGASYGYFMKAALDRGYDAFGIEIAPEPCDYARRELGLDVFSGQLCDAHFGAESFSVVTMLNVLEHLRDPYASLREIYELLEPGGVVAIVVPNLNFGYPFLFFFSRVLRRLEFKVNISVFDVPTHLFLFTPTTLRRLLLAAGFAPVSIANAPVIYNVSPIKTLAKLSVKSLTDFLYRLSNGAWILSYSILAVAQKPFP